VIQSVFGIRQYHGIITFTFGYAEELQDSQQPSFGYICPHQRAVPMELYIIIASSLAASLLTFFSGFGLGTIMLPVFALFFDLQLAIALTGVVHFLNNLFKWILTHKHIDWPIAWQFGIPAFLAAIPGAWLLALLGEQAAVYRYNWQGHTYEILPVKLTIAGLLVVFALMELIPRLQQVRPGKYSLLIGGLLSGFFGGLSGHQGALRSAFLVKLRLSKESFVATGVIIACLVDISRLSMYAEQLSAEALLSSSHILVAACLAAFAGALAGNLLLRKVSIGFLQVLVAILLMVFAGLLGLGIL
jgi:uncharacterized membrane protein YfcA